MVILLSGQANTYKKLSKFKSIKQFNSHFEQWMVFYKETFTKSELVALKRLVRYSANERSSLVGICYAKIQTIVSATHENAFIGISRSSFERMLRKAIKIGMVTVHNTYKNNKKGHNVYVFNDIEDKINEKQESKSPVVNTQIDSVSNQIDVSNEGILTERETKQSSETSIKNNIKNTYQKDVCKDLSLYQRIKRYLKSTTGNDGQANSLYGVVRSQTAKLKGFDKSEVEQVAFNAVVETIQKNNRRKFDNVNGFLFRTLWKMLDSYIKKDEDIQHFYAEEVELIKPHYNLSNFKYSIADYIYN